MELMESPQETWASEPYVQQLLAYMLAMPTADHSVAVATLLDGDDLRAAQAVSLLRASNRLDFSKQKWQASVSKNKGVAYHTWMYHFLGGAPAKLLPPPTSTAASETRWSATLRVEAQRAEAAYKREVDRPRRAGADGLQQLRTLRCAAVDPGILRPAEQAVAAPPPAPPPAGSDAEWEQQTARLLAFALGTHPRVGFGYASKESPCGVRLLAGQSDVLGLIAARVRGLPPRTLAPPKPEVVQLRAQNAELHTEVVKLRELLDEHRVREVELQQSETRAWRRVESAERSAAETHERCERRIEAEIERVEACRHCRLRAPASTRPAAHHHHCHHTTCSRARPRRKCGAAPGRTRRARLRRCAGCRPRATSRAPTDRGRLWLAVEACGGPGSGGQGLGVLCHDG